MDTGTLLDTYLAKKHMMQLATSAHGKSWCCTVYYVHDRHRNLYWASLPTRRHSQEIAKNPRVAAAIPVRHVNGEKVVGIQLEGTAAEIAPDPKNREIVAAYAKKFHRDEAWIREFTAGKTLHRLYKLTPENFVLFDEEHFPENPRVSVG